MTYKGIEITFYIKPDSKGWKAVINGKQYGAFTEIAETGVMDKLRDQAKETIDKVLELQIV